MQIKDVTKRRDDELVIHYIDDDGNYQSLRAYPSEIIAWHRAAQQSVQPTGGILRDLQSFSTPEQNPAPEHYRVPPTSG